MKEVYSGAENSQEYADSLEKARKQFVALIKRLNNPITDLDYNALTDPSRQEFNPGFSYPDLFDLDQIQITDKSNIIEENLAVARKFEEQGHDPSIQEQFDKDKAINGLNNLELLRLAQAMQSEGSSIEVVTQQFIELNEAMVGPVDESLYQGIVNSLDDIAERIPAHHTKAHEIATGLKGRLPIKAGEERIVTLPDETFYKYQEVYKALFSEWLKEVIPEERSEYDSIEIQTVFLNAINSMGFEDWEVIIDDNVSSIKVSMKDKKVTIPKNRKLPHAELCKKLVHETGHIIRGWNGAKVSRMGENGLPDYIDAEEGLMSYGEEFISGTRQPNITYIERYLGVGTMLGTLDDGYKKDFSEVFSVMWRARALMENDNSDSKDIDNQAIKEAKEASLMNALRLFRGGDGHTPGVGWTKDKVYYEGYVKLTDVLVDFEQRIGIENLDWLFIAKYDPTNRLHNKYLGVPL